MTAKIRILCVFPSPGVPTGLVFALSIFVALFLEVAFHFVTNGTLLHSGIHCLDFDLRPFGDEVHEFWNETITLARTLADGLTLNLINKHNWFWVHGLILIIIFPVFFVLQEYVLDKMNKRYPVVTLEKMDAPAQEMKCILKRYNLRIYVCGTKREWIRIFQNIDVLFYIIALICGFILFPVVHFSDAKLGIGSLLLFVGVFLGALIGVAITFVFDVIKWLWDDGFPKAFEFPEVKMELFSPIPI